MLNKFKDSKITQDQVEAMIYKLVKTGANSAWIGYDLDFAPKYELFIGVKERGTTVNIGEEKNPIKFGDI